MLALLPVVSVSWVRMVSRDAKKLAAPQSPHAVGFETIAAADQASSTNDPDTQARRRERWRTEAGFQSDRTIDE